jgi:hypothetical protein
MIVPTKNQVFLVNQRIVTPALLTYNNYRSSIQYVLGQFSFVNPRFK